jgi:IS30 family transposase
LISGSKNSHIATLVERYSRFVMLVKVDGKDTESVVAALAKQVCKLPSSGASADVGPRDRDGSTQSAQRRD